LRARQTPNSDKGSCWEQMGQCLPKSTRSSVIFWGSNQHGCFWISVGGKHFAHSPGFETKLPVPQIGVELSGGELRLGPQVHRLGLPETLHFIWSSLPKHLIGASRSRSAGTFKKCIRAINLQHDQNIRFRHQRFYIRQNISSERGSRIIVIRNFFATAFSNKGGPSIHSYKTFLICAL